MPAKLNKHFVRRIARFRRAGLYWKEICAALKIHKGTAEMWVEKGKEVAASLESRKEPLTDREELLLKLHRELEAIDAEILTASSETIIEAATQGNRLVKVVEKETFDKDGNPIKEVTKTFQGPSTSDAWKVLERLREKKWGRKDGIIKIGDESGSNNSAQQINELDSAFDRVEDGTSENNE